MPHARHSRADAPGGKRKSRVYSHSEEGLGESLYEEDFVITVSSKRLISSSGLTLAGGLLRHADFRKEANRLGSTKVLTHRNYDCIAAYIGLLCQGKTAYDDVREMLEDLSFFCRALKINSIPSPETLRQRLDMLGKALFEGDLLQQANERMLSVGKADITPSFSGHYPLDIDVSVHDNSKTKREGVAWTYHGITGYAPIYAYLGEEGFMVDAQLRPGSDHSQNEKTLDFLRGSIRRSQRLIPAGKKILVRMDSGNDARDNIVICTDEKADFLIKRNLRREDIGAWLATAKELDDNPYEERDGKTIYTASTMREIGLERPVRIVIQATERTIDKKGQILLVPDIEVETWWTSLEADEADIIELYHQHALCEQFHAEVKSDIGLERFPSGYFDTNGAILKLAMIAYNILRMIGVRTLELSREPLTRHSVMRLRAKTVMQRLVYIAGHVTEHARSYFINLGRSNIWRSAFQSVYIAYV